MPSVPCQLFDEAESGGASAPCSFDPSKREPVIRMPKADEVSVRYQASSTAECAPLVMYMDLEVASESVPTEQLAKRTHCVQANVLSADLAVGREWLQT